MTPPSIDDLIRWAIYHLVQGGNDLAQTTHDRYIMLEHPDEEDD